MRKGDGMVVIAMWQAAVQSLDGACMCLLWAPNVDGARPWSDTCGGRERLQHCKLALERQNAEGLLVQGEALDGRLPEDRARTVLGIDAETVVHVQVELRGAEYWAIGERKRRRRSLQLDTSVQNTKRVSADADQPGRSRPEKNGGGPGRPRFFSTHLSTG